MARTETRLLQAVRMLPCPEPAEAALFSMPAYPVPQEQRPRLLDFMAKLSGALRARGNEQLQATPTTPDSTAPTRRLVSHIFGHIIPSKNPSVGALLSPNMRNWVPQMGSGVWPARPAPALWDKQDFENLEPGHPPRDTVYPVFRITKDGDARENARAVLFGTGSVLEIISSDSGTDLVAAGKKLLLPTISEPAFRSFGYYLPLLDASAIQSATFDQVNQWLCGGACYLRESIDDGGLLVISLDSLQPVLKALGATPVADHAGHLHIPVD